METPYAREGRIVEATNGLNLLLFKHEEGNRDEELRWFALEKAGKHIQERECELEHHEEGRTVGADRSEPDYGNLRPKIGRPSRRDS